MSRTRSLVDPFAPSLDDPLYVSSKNLSKNLKDLENLNARDQRSSVWKDQSLRSVAGGGGIGNEGRDGGWICNVCGYHNFIKNLECQK